MQQAAVIERMPGDTDAALGSTLAVASVGIATLKMLETLLPAAAEEVERESLLLSRHFRTLVDYVDGTQPPPDVCKAIEGIVLAMQFQDRNTQVMENAAGILERYRSLLEDISANIDMLRAGHVATGENIDDALRTILSSIRLSDIRTRYVEALKKANIHAAPPGSAAEQDPSGSIELF